MSSISFDSIISILEGRVNQGESMSFSPAGRSMLPTIRNKSDLVTISPIDELKKYDIVLYRRKSGKIVLHRIVKLMGDDEYVLCGDSQFLLEYPISREQIIGVVSSIVRSGKLIDCRKPPLLYRIYVILWHKRLLLDLLLYELKMLLNKRA